MYIDAHVHFRDLEQRQKETVKHGLEVARDSNLDAVFAMPNTNPSITEEEHVKNYLQLADSAKVPEVFFGLYLGLTKDTDQIKRAIQTQRKYFPKVVGLKMFAGESVGSLAIVNPKEQYEVFKVLTTEGYKGVLAQHCEKESLMNPKIWDSRYPITHSFARPETAEIEAIRDQINFAKETNFKGKLHICHVSTQESVDLIKKAKSEDLDISSELSIHHLFYDWNQMLNTDGILWKMNPPLRAPHNPPALAYSLKSGDIDFIATDHAPHTFKEKTTEKYMSGIPAISAWPLLGRYLNYLQFPEERIKEITHSAICKRFEIEIPRTNRKIYNRTNEYAFNPFEKLEELLGYPDYA